SKPRILSNRYKLLKKIGKGAYGTAYLVEDLRSAEKFKVLKEVHIGELDPEETVEAIHEAKLLGKLSHSAILKFFNCFVNLPSFCMVTEYCDEGDLDQAIQRLKKAGLHLPVATTERWLIQILLGVEYLHGKRILHRDLKTKNVFLKGGMVKIGDFGIARVLMNSVDMATTFLGTPYFMSPELLKHQGYNAKSDVWSVGCILYEMCAQEHAYTGHGLMRILFSICEDPCPTLPDRYPRALQAVLERMLEKEPQRRASARELLREPHLRRRSKQIHEEAAAAEASCGGGGGAGRRLLREESTADGDGVDRVDRRRAAALLTALGLAEEEPQQSEDEADAEECDDLVPSGADGRRDRKQPIREAAMVNPELADTYYTPDFDEEAQDEEREDAAAAAAGASCDTTLRFAQELEAALARSGRLASAFEDAPDEATGSRFGQAGLDRTLSDLRRRCERRAAESDGAFDFAAVYSYLTTSAGRSAAQKALRLREITSDAEAAGLVEQLVFLESLR
ncbi:hypothetical protein BOX15_Mlig023502g2, partial [Macrostomum lignano]